MTQTKTLPISECLRSAWAIVADDLCPSIIPATLDGAQTEAWCLTANYVRLRDIPTHQLGHVPAWVDDKGALFEVAYGHLSIIRFNHEHPYFIANPSTYPPFRVQLWGGDDLGFERHYDTEPEAVEAFEELQTGKVSITDLMALGFQYA